MAVRRKGKVVASAMRGKTYKKARHGGRRV